MQNSRPTTPKPKRQFFSDTGSGPSPAAREYRDLAESNGHLTSYGTDPWASRLEQRLRELFEFEPLRAFVLATGTASNVLGLAALSVSGTAIATSQYAHLETDERGAPSFFLGQKTLLLPNSPDKPGRIDISGIPGLFRRDDIHFARPAIVSVTQVSELGTTYKLDELNELREMKKKYPIRLHMDGSRFANAVVSLHVKPKEISYLMDIDVMTLGMCKNGAPIGDIIVYFDPALANNFHGWAKPSGHVIPKQAPISAAMCGLLEHDEYYVNAKNANDMAQLMKNELIQILPKRNESILYPVEANAVFVDFPDFVLHGLRERGWIIYTFIGGAARLMCSWDIEPNDVFAFVSDVRDLIDKGDLRTADELVPDFQGSKPRF